MIYEKNCKRCGKPIKTWNLFDSPFNPSYCSNCYKKYRNEEHEKWKNSKKIVNCPKCNGTGRIKGYRCMDCEGTGKVTRYDYGSSIIQPHKGEDIKGEEKKEDCIITTACIKSKCLNDDCLELKILRNFRDDYILKTENGKEEIREYYTTAPLIVEKIDSMKEAKNIYHNIYNNMIIPSITMIKMKKYQVAHKLYKDNFLQLMIKYLTINH